MHLLTDKPADGCIGNSHFQKLYAMSQMFRALYWYCKGIWCSIVGMSSRLQLCTQIFMCVERWFWNNLMDGHQKWIAEIVLGQKTNSFQQNYRSRLVWPFWLVNVLSYCMVKRIDQCSSKIHCDMIKLYKISYNNIKYRYWRQAKKKLFYVNRKNGT